MKRKPFGKSEFKLKYSLTLDDVKNVLESNMEVLEMDFEDKRYGEIAKLLYKHYKGILHLLNKVKK